MDCVIIFVILLYFISIVDVLLLGINENMHDYMIYVTINWNASGVESRLVKCEKRMFFRPL